MAARRALGVTAVWLSAALACWAQGPASTSAPKRATLGPPTTTLPEEAVVLPLVLPPSSQPPLEESPLPWQVTDKPATPLKTPAVPAAEKPLPINLAAALRLAGAQPVTVALAEERVVAANAQLLRAKAQWLPTLYLGTDYERHDGQIQEVAGKIFTTSRSSLLAGGGAALLLTFSDAIFDPLAARRRWDAQAAGAQVARNDAVLETAEAYFGVQQARGELAGAEDVVRRGEDLLKRTEKLAAGLVAPVEASRVRAELARRRQALYAAKERWAVSSAELARVLRLEPGTLLEPLEPPHLQVTIIPTQHGAAELMELALIHRPELAQFQALVQAAQERVRQEKARPFIPSLLVRGNGTNPSGTLGAGVFGGGRNSDFSNFSARSDWGVMLLWELQNLGVGNKARLDERRSESAQANWEFLRVKDRVVAEVTQAVAQAKYAAERLAEAEKGVKDAVDSVDRNFEGLSQTRRAGEILLLVIRPQEAVAALQALQQAYSDYYAAVADYDRAQFRLYRAVGLPAPECLPK